ncbi:MAG: hypothetical protein MUC89_22025 [Acetobacteraceae bacterium]|jgi:hypothetical protein|nr:hypothetical protein [Acetobacteraceae bacterium]
MIVTTTLHAAEPERLARFLALLWGTEAMPVPPDPVAGAAGGWIAFADGEGNGCVIILPAFLPRPEARISLATRLSETAVHALAATEGWTSRHARRFGDEGSAVGHTVVEVMIESFLVLEVLPEAMAAARAAAMRPWRWGAMLAGLGPQPNRAAPRRPVPALPAMPFDIRRAA